MSVHTTSLQNISSRREHNYYKHSNKHARPVGGDKVYINDPSNTREESFSPSKIGRGRCLWTPVMWCSDAKFSCKFVNRPSSGNQMERNWYIAAIVCLAEYLHYCGLGVNYVSMQTLYPFMSCVVRCSVQWVREWVSGVGRWICGSQIQVMWAWAHFLPCVQHGVYTYPLIWYAMCTL